MGQIIFVSLLVLFASTIFILNRKYGMLRDDRVNLSSAYSFANVQIAFWSNIIIAAFIATMIKRMAFPDVHYSLQILLGITTMTSVFSSVAEGKVLAPVGNSKGFWTDILNGGDLHRWQSVLFNLGVGGFFIYSVYIYLPDVSIDINKVMPQIPDSILSLLSVSNGAYIVVKATKEK